jgi:hypothetical protein
MTLTAATGRVPTGETTPAGRVRTTRALLACGAAAGPAFIVVGVAQAALRPGFDPVKHPLSLLSVGDPGWIQIANFVLAGLAFLAGAVGVRRALHPGRAGTWGPVLYAVFGVSLVAGGVFVADPGLGFPPGTPDGIPAETSWHSTVHSVAPVTGFLALTVVCFVFARRSASQRRRGWAAFSVATGVLVQVLGGVSGATLNFLPMWAAMVLGFGWPSAQLARVRAELPSA